jgi:tRNA(Met) cytidine acetyltransferase
MPEMKSDPHRHRHCVVLRGEPQDTAEEALRLLALLPPADVLWVADTSPNEALSAIPAPRLHTLLGRSFDAVVLDLHRDLNADIIGQSHGFIWGGGALILRLPPAGVLPEEMGLRLGVYPYSPHEVGQRFMDRFERILAGSTSSIREPLPQASHEVTGTSEQAEAIDTLVHSLQSQTPGVSVVLANRGRGKSAALGSALRTILTEETLRVAISAGHPDATREVHRFAGLDEEDPRAFVDIKELLYGDTSWDVIVIDEAAQIPVPVLQKIVTRHPHAHFALATTTHGYEGTGRGFVLRFLEWLKESGCPLNILEMNEPIRWSHNDPLEALIFELLLLNAESEAPPETFDIHRVEHVILDRDKLVLNQKRLRGFFGLLIHAHYRTTPTDLHRLLDAPNIRLHALLYEDKVVAATMVAIEGTLPPETCDDLYRGHSRLRGHALPETLISHSGQSYAGEFKMVRSIRIAVPPALRRRGLATLLIEEVHKTYQPDLFGTLFGVTDGLLQFRRSVGYEVIRLGASRGSRTGEPAAIMIRPVTKRAEDLVQSLRGVLARDLPTQLSLMEAGDELHLDPALKSSLMENLPSPALLTVATQREAVQAFAFGPRTHEAAATSLYSYVRERLETLDEMPETEQIIIRKRILEGAGWEDVMKAVNLPSHSAAMRLLRRAVRQFVLICDPELTPDKKTMNSQN